MTYVTEQTSAELRAHMRRLQAMPGWHNPLDDRLFKEIVDQDREIEQLRASIAAPGAAIAAREQDKCADCGDAVPKGVCYCRENCVHAVGYASPKEAPATPQGETLTDEQVMEIGHRHFKPNPDLTEKSKAAFLAAVRECVDAALKTAQTTAQPGERKDQE